VRPTPTGHKSRVFYFNDMAKRFTDNGKWDDPWFAELPSKYKLFYLYLLDECDHAGVWKVNFRKAQFMVGESLEQSEVRRYMGDRIRIVDDAYWFVTKFIRFQYGSLKGDKVSASVSAILEKHGLTDIIEEQTEGAIKGLPSPYQGAKDKDRDKEKVKDLVKDSLTRENFSEVPSIEQCKTTAQVDGFTADQGEAYYHMRNATGWCVPRGKDGNLYPIVNWRSDMATAIRKGYVDREVKSAKPLFDPLPIDFTF